MTGSASLKAISIGVAFAIGLAVGGAQALTIDQFNFFQEVDTDPATAGIPSSSTTTDAATIIGAEREISIVPNGGGGTSSFTVNPGANPGLAVFGNAPSTNSIVTITYDGIGTGGFAATDFTESGTQDRFLFNIILADFSQNLTMQVTSTGGFASEAMVVTPAPVFGTPAEFGVEYSNFTTLGGAIGPADFTNITSVTLIFETTSDGSDLQLDFLSTSPPPPPEISEPQALAIFSIALLGIAGYRRRLRKTA